MTVCQMELFLVALCFPGTFLSENCWYLASDDDGHEQMLVHIFVPCGGYCAHFLNVLILCTFFGMTVCQMELFLVALCFPGTFLSENCWCLASDDDGHEQMLVHIFVPNGGYCVHFLICVCNKVKSFVISCYLADHSQRIGGYGCFWQACLHLVLTGEQKSLIINPYILTSICIFSILFLIHIIRCSQGEFKSFFY